jgi:hypothetical protein
MRWMRVIFPLATFSMADGESFKLLIFNKRRFEKWYKIMLHKKEI